MIPDKRVSGNKEKKLIELILNKNEKEQSFDLILMGLRFM